MTFDIADTQSGGKDKPAKSRFIETEGKTVFDAVRVAAISPTEDCIRRLFHLDYQQNSCRKRADTGDGYNDKGR